LKKELAPGLPPVRANAGKLQQVFLNLLVNAAQAIEKGGTKENLIGIRTGREGDNLFVQITDTGKGIPEEVLPRIFDPFFTTKPMGVGTGLGLYISADIMKRYQGTLEVQSREGVGTTFTLRLPIESARSVLPGGKILVVDDDPDNLEVLERIFEKNYQVQTALSAPAALEMLGTGNTDVIVSDIYMPDMDGLEFHRIVARKYPSLGRRFVFFTGGTLKSEMRDYLRTVSNPLLEKPFNFNALLQAVAQSQGDPGDRS
jgi:two-component system, cell cycle sensor histidine kinase and response regulator CckA